MHRRNFIQTSVLSTIGSVLGIRHMAWGQNSGTGLVFDAMGEIRTVYTPELVEQILASGTRAITITLTDPKITGDKGFHQLMEDLAVYDEYFQANPKQFVKAFSIGDIDRAVKERKLAVFYLIQNADPVEKDLGRVDTLYSLGLRSVQLTYNDQNYVGHGCYERNDGGLSDFGMQLIDKLNRKNILVDLSHAGMKTMSDAITASRKPVIISHSTCKTLYKHARNTTDENLKLLADKGGVIGMCQIRIFMTQKKTDNLDVYFDHIDHAVKVAGIEHVAIGSDRDHRVIPDTEEEKRILFKEEGAQFTADKDWPLYLEKPNGPRRMEIVRDGLVKRKYTEDQIGKIMGGNLYRLYKEVIG